ncbi:DUF488 domain-containing protein [Plantactinospora endophytica]|uniref:DUF488 domain-containing protein n=1 Tax=Plantactinospora endophytica TaxID=673535 RepID=A0ABQ4E8R4_9ACTN|nr:DUF488 domain-containing protein [Plantactinospora endophytica]GIG91071.1 hypothetical protein Pen02_60070 [Plantactinospora endophytica]
MTVPTDERFGLVGVGYEGRDIGDFVADLVAMGVSRLVDVRLTPISRKRGFSKTALGQALDDAGIAYEHRRELGNPKDNRTGFTGSPETLTRARAVYAGLLARPEAVEALDALADASQRELVALLCFEADQRQCHRDLVLQAAHDRRPIVEAASKFRGH